jgi:hypothetical protein
LTDRLTNFTKQSPFSEANIPQQLNKPTSWCGTVIQFRDKFNTSYGETRNIKKLGGLTGHGGSQKVTSQLNGLNMKQWEVTKL